MLLSDYEVSERGFFKNASSASQLHSGWYYLHINYCFALSWHIYWQLKGQVFFELLSFHIQL